jgi:hypothetical protein
LPERLRGRIEVGQIGSPVQECQADARQTFEQRLRDEQALGACEHGRVKPGIHPRFQ